MIIFYPSGIRAHYNSDGETHRENGPASIYYDNNFWYKSWYIKGCLHRNDGPAIESSRGYKEYWYHGVKMNVNSTEEFIRYLKLLAFI